MEFLTDLAVFDPFPDGTLEEAKLGHFLCVDLIANECQVVAEV